MKIRFFLWSNLEIDGLTFTHPWHLPQLFQARYLKASENLRASKEVTKQWPSSWEKCLENLARLDRVDTIFQIKKNYKLDFQNSSKNVNIILKLNWEKKKKSIFLHLAKFINGQNWVSKKFNIRCFPRNWLWFCEIIITKFMISIETVMLRLWFWNKFPALLFAWWCVMLNWC